MQHAHVAAVLVDPLTEHTSGLVDPLTEHTSGFIDPPLAEHAELIDPPPSTAVSIRGPHRVATLAEHTASFFIAGTNLLTSGRKFTAHLRPQLHDLRFDGGDSIGKCLQVRHPTLR